ncbi:phage replication initiation protein, NGO0469 family [Alysiella crassa]|uniref:Uncharacterized protein n=1 Tax=Alysiella crassa TaxID=153491 RepID=A0A376BVR0_9NEIS|nr:hypothetical protein [Alysiella crassa]UOP06544.1 hypothetical protein LVJ80_12410 [Alysiella crassa]SSY81077.1 Uncharacterised protein [Alysiella crassa]
MALIIQKTSSISEPAPSGLHHAHCIRVIDLGQQFNKFNGKKQHKIMIAWEIVGKTKSDGNPHIAAKTYTASLNEKAKFFQDLCGWYGDHHDVDEFDFNELLGLPCAINITHKPSKDGTKTYAEVQSIAPPMEGIALPKPQTTPKAFDLSAPDWELFAEFSDYTKDLIRKSPEYAALDLPANAPPPLAAETPKPSKMPLNDNLIKMLGDSLKTGTMTLEKLFESYEVTEEQRLHFESLVSATE